MRDDAAILILTHGRADNVKTDKALRRCGYTGKIFYIVDDEDEQLEQYVKNFGKDKVIIFSKEEAAKYTDTADTLPEKNVVVFARNMCHKIANDLGLKYFVEVDDDYNTFGYRVLRGNKLHEIKIKNFDRVFDAIFGFLDVSGALSIGIAQGGDYVGGTNSGVWKEQLSRKIMNMFFCRVDRPFKFYGRLNEDVTMYTYLGQQGKLFFTIAGCVLHQLMTQQNAGGLTDSYLSLGTYVKSFYSILYSPSCVKLFILSSWGHGKGHERIHHCVRWNNCTPKIINEKWKRGGRSENRKT